MTMWTVFAKFCSSHKRVRDRAVEESLVNRFREYCGGEPELKSDCDDEYIGRWRYVEEICQVQGNSCVARVLRKFRDECNIPAAY